MPNTQQHAGKDNRDGWNEQVPRRPDDKGHARLPNVSEGAQVGSDACVEEQQTQQQRRQVERHTQSNRTERHLAEKQTHARRQCRERIDGNEQPK
jgi:hypothetical protein